MTSDHLKKTGKITGTFFFKKFKVDDNLSTMKVGTDAVLLGTSVKMSSYQEILEIGTGCGVIALILAHRGKAHIDAIEIDEQSATKAAENFSRNPCDSKIEAHHISLQQFVAVTQKQYDLIVSNPPFFSRSLKSSHLNRNLSRHDATLTHDELARFSHVLLKPEGSLWVILPATESKEFIKTAEYFGFHLHLITKIFPKPGKCHLRSILEFKKNVPEFLHEKVLTIRDQDNNYSKEYKELTGEFYLDF